MINRFTLLAAALSAAFAITGAPATAVASSPMGGLVAPAPVQGWLVAQLTTGWVGDRAVLVHGRNLHAARLAATRAGLTPLHDLKGIGVAVASGSPLEVEIVARQPGVTYVEGDQPLAFFTDSSHEATRGLQASALVDRRGHRLDGSGVSVANLKNVCGLVVSTPDTCFGDVGPRVDTDTASLGGHGTHVAGIVAGQPTRLTDGTVVRGAAPGARIVSLSVGAGIAVVNSDLAMEWVLEHHRRPCGAGVSTRKCPPIRVVNNSWGPVGGGAFDPRSAIAKLQRRLAAAGVVTVWANGNDGGEGTANHSNPPGQDPTAGIISVASYFDRDTGTRRGEVSDFSSRGNWSSPRTWPDLAAPGEDVTSACRPYLWICASELDPRSGTGLTRIAAFNTISGTSMAAPHIAGIAAQLFQAKANARPARIEHALKTTAATFASTVTYPRPVTYTISTTAWDRAGHSTMTTQTITVI